MPEFVFGNFFATELQVGVTTGTTTLQVPPSASLDLPLFDTPDLKEARLTLWDGQLRPEIVGCTKNLQDGNLIVTRGLEGTTPQAWGAGTQVISIISAEVLNTALEAFFDFEVVLAASFLKLSGGILTGPLILAGPPTVALGAATKSYVDSVQGTGLPLSGGTMQGDINMNSHAIVNLPAPSVGSNPATKTYADSLITSPTAILNDFEGSLATTGGPLTFAVTTNFGAGGGYTNGDRLCVRFNGTNSAAATLNRDALGAKAIHIVPGVPIPVNVIIPGVPTSIVFDAVANAWLLENIHVLQTNEIGDLQITTAKIVDANITTVKIADANVTTVKIADANVTTIKIADANVTPVKLSADAKVFQGQRYHIRNEQANNSTGGALSSGSWNTRALNTEKVDDLGITTSSNQMSLVAGTYWIEAKAAAQFLGNSNNGGNAVCTHKLRVRNVTDGATLVVGMGERFQHNDDGGGSVQSVDMTLLASVEDQFTIAGTKAVEIQSWVSNGLASPTTRDGGQINSGEVEVYVDVKLWKLL